MMSHTHQHVSKKRITIGILGLSLCKKDHSKLSVLAIIVHLSNNGNLQYEVVSLNTLSSAIIIDILFKQFT